MPEKLRVTDVDPDACTLANVSVTPEGDVMSCRESMISGLTWTFTPVGVLRTANDAVATFEMAPLPSLAWNVKLSKPS